MNAFAKTVVYSIALLGAEVVLIAGIQSALEWFNGKEDQDKVAADEADARDAKLLESESVCETNAEAGEAILVTREDKLSEALNGSNSSSEDEATRTRESNDSIFPLAESVVKSTAVKKTNNGFIVGSKCFNDPQKPANWVKNRRRQNKRKKNANNGKNVRNTPILPTLPTTYRVLTKPASNYDCCYYSNKKLFSYDYYSEPSTPVHEVKKRKAIFPSFIFPPDGCYSDETGNIASEEMCSRDRAGNFWISKEPYDPSTHSEPDGSLEDFNYRYVKEELLAEGTFGKVYLCREVNSKVFVAAKFFDADSGFWVPGEPFEVKIMREVHHPNILNLVEWFVEGKEQIVIVPYPGGMDLRKYRSQRGRISEEELKVMSRKILSALKCLHENGYIHQDVKAENVLFNSETGEYYLIDFGLALPYNQKCKEFFSI